MKTNSYQTEQFPPNRVLSDNIGIAYILFYNLNSFNLISIVYLNNQINFSCTYEFKLSCIFYFWFDIFSQGAAKFQFNMK